MPPREPIFSAAHQRHLADYPESPRRPATTASNLERGRVDVGDVTLLDGCVLACGRAVVVDKPTGGGGLLHKWVLDREEERVLAEALWSRPRVRIGCPDQDP